MHVAGVIDMKNKTRKMTITAMMVALSVIFIYLSSVVPAGQLGLIAISTLFGIAAVVEVGISSGILVFAGTSILCILLVPDKNIAFTYFLFFGYYPVLKSLIERLHNLLAEWALKLLSVNVALTVIVFVFSGLIFNVFRFGGNLLVFYVIVNLIFVAFDIGISKLISFYLHAISSKIK